MDEWTNLVPKSIANKYEFYNFNNALEILSLSQQKEFTQLVNALEQFQISLADICEQGGNESKIPKKLRLLLPEWKEIEISGDLTVRLYEGKKRKTVDREFLLPDYISGHKIDFVNGTVAVDMEWNSKDQTFDRDLYAFRTFYECGVITCGVIITRSERMNTVFSGLGKEISGKYGASTTWIGKLLPRIHARRHGGCPLLVIGLTPETVVDWEEEKL